MKRRTLVSALFAALALVPAISKPKGECEPPKLSDPQSWLPVTPKANNAKPKSHAEGGTDCPFYQAAWHRFLIATQPDSYGSPAFLSYLSFEGLFDRQVSPVIAKQTGRVVSLAPRAIQSSNSLPNINQGIAQAGLRGLLIDQAGHPIFYAIHVNGDFQKFLADNQLHNKYQLQHANNQLSLPPGIVEFKSAWQIVSDAAPPSNYFTIRANIPVLAVSNGAIVPTGKTREMTLALLAFHVVFSLQGHPEMIWSTFEHIDAEGNRDNAPAAKANPSQVSGDTVISASSSPLYKEGTLASAANNLPNNSEYVAHFDEESQMFDKGGSVFATSIYRLFPGSKTDGHEADDSEEDDEIVSLNKNMRALFASAKTPASDKRQFYQLAGAIWLDKPRYFTLNRSFEIRSNQSTDDKASIIGGEGRLSSTAIESFTQAETSQPNCFSCHDTRAIKNDAPPHNIIVQPKLLNMSHIFSKFLSGVPATNPQR